jgi:F0F1-type ATP synthase membrane subunit c/vacuolar-type H+-ATPase subunit K
MRFWFIVAAMMGPKFFRRFIILFALGMGLMLYSLVRS